MKLYRPATILVGIMFVLLGGLTRLAEPDQVYDEANRDLVRGTIGQALPYNGSTVKVNRVKFAHAYLTGASDEKAVETTGIYVAVEYDTVRGTQDPQLPSPQLLTDEGTVYAPIGDTNAGQLDFAEPGFGVNGVLLFEVNPADVKGLTLKIRSTPLYTVLTRDVAVDLGIPDEAIGQRMIDAAAPEYLIPRAVKRVAS
ncbi:hypothetical protein [Kribbella sp. NPDC051620]|uniref:hypothetical protein n=1 Tax=Kribbella sp. NPDC051620 TaxID=3364120 RepID=UPI0037AC2BB2